MSSCTKLKSKWIKGFNINSVTVKLIEKKGGSSLEGKSAGDYFLNIIPVAQRKRSKIKKWDLLKLKTFCKAKYTVNKTKQHPTEWKKYSHQPHISQRADLYIYKEFRKPSNKISNNPTKEWGRNF